MKETRGTAGRANIITLMLILLCLSLAISIVTTRIEIYREQKTVEMLKQKITETQLENDDLERMMSGDEAEYIERIARDKLGYASIDERVYIDINS